MARPTIPLFPLGSVLFPGLALPLHIFEERYRRLVSDLSDADADDDRSFGVVAIRAGHEVGATSVNALHEVGTTAVLRRVTPYPDGRSDILTSGGRRFRLHSVDHSRPYLQGEVEWLDEPTGPRDEVDRLATAVGAQFHAYQDLLGSSVGEDSDDEQRTLPDDPTVLSYLVSAAMVLDLADRQRLLATETTVARLGRLSAILRREDALIRLLAAIPASDLLRGAVTVN